MRELLWRDDRIRWGRDQSGTAEFDVKKVQLNFMSSSRGIGRIRNTSKLPMPRRSEFEADT
jgi:hypothetical protein